MFTFICMSMQNSESSLEITRLKLQKVHIRKEKRSTEDMKKNPAWQKGLPSNSAEQLGCGKNNNCIIVLK
jgi:hypothetical protein